MKPLLLKPNQNSRYPYKDTHRYEMVDLCSGTDVSPEGTVWASTHIDMFHGCAFYPALRDGNTVKVDCRGYAILLKE
jgi:hypothetical protein